MANVSSVGIGSGVLTSELIDKLVAAEREPVEKRLDSKEEDLSAELSLFGQIQSAVTDFRLPSRTLADPAAFNSLSVTAGDKSFSGTAISPAVTGSYTLEITALAKSHSLTTGEFVNADTIQLGTGALAFTVNSVTTNITIDSSNNTLNGIASAINASSTLNVTASVINTGTGYKLVLNADNTGLKDAIAIAVTDTGDSNNTDTNGLSRLSYVSGALNLTQNQAAADAAFKLNGISITRSSNNVNDVISGVTLAFNSTNSGTPASLVVAQETDTVVDKVQEFVDKFNAFQKLIADNTKFNTDNPAASGILLGDSSTRSILTRIQNIIGTSVKGLENASVRSMADIGISTDKTSGQLSFDSTIFVSKLKSDPLSVTAIFADQGRTSDGQVKFNGASINSKVGTYAISVTTLATKGVNTGSVALGGSTTIDASNDSLTVTIDGVLSGAITLANGTYNAAALSTEIQSKINADSLIKAGGKSVSVSLDGTNQLLITSNAYGTASKVAITTVDTNTVVQLGLSVSSGVDGVDVAGTINGVTATGSGQDLTGAAKDNSEGIRVKITGGSTGSRGTVTYIEGVGEQLVDLINGLLGTNGTITAKNERLNTQLGTIAEERDKLNLRIIALTDRLVRQFTAADILIARLKSTQDFISQQLDAIIASNKKK